MSYCEFAPSKSLQPWVEAFWCSSQDPDLSSGVTSSRILPDGCIDWIFTQWDGPETRSNSLEVVGTMTHWQTADDTGAPERVAVRFRPGAAAPLLGCPASELTDGTMPLAALWSGAEEVQESFAALDAEQRLGAMISVLEKRVRGLAPDRCIVSAVNQLETATAPLPVTELASTLGLSQRQLRRRFLASVGLGPKRFMRIVRFRRLLRAVEDNPRPRWSEAALAAGYYDQAHMISEFRALVGRTPAEHCVSACETPVAVSSNPSAGVRPKLAHQEDSRRCLKQGWATSSCTWTTSIAHCASTTKVSD